ncbi:MAG: hypothetical protein ACK5IM_14540 [Demequina sp.]|uniref:hypothetical protein n=1 Tax=Demequina sp. TaxID=2050685 RepID=UPI003A836A36
MPPATQRGTSDDSEPPEITEPEAEAWWLPVAKIVGASLLALLVLIGPIVAIVVWKIVRRRRRKGRAPADAVHGGWDEYLDLAADAGLDAMPLATRSEVAAAYATPHGAALATMTDRATFSGQGTDPADAARFWDLVEEDRRHWLTTRGWWRRLRMRLSLRSLWHATGSSSADAATPQSTARPQWRSDHTGATARRGSRSRTASRRGRKDGSRG